MSNYDHDIRAKDAERRELDEKLRAFLDQGKMIQILGTTPIRDTTNYNNSQHRSK